MNDPSTKKASSLQSPTQQKLSDTSSSSAVIVATPSVTSEPDDIALRDTGEMESSQDNAGTQVVEEPQLLEEQETPVPTPPTEEAKVEVVAEKKSRGGKKIKRSAKKSKSKVEVPSASDSDADSESEDGDSEDDLKTKRKRKQKQAAKRAAAKKKQKAKAKSKNSKKDDSTSDDTSSDSSSDSESESEVEDKKSRKKARKAKEKKKKSKKVDTSSDDSDPDSSSSSSSSDSSSDDERSKRKRSKAKAKRKLKKSKKADTSSEDSDSDSDASVLLPSVATDPLTPDDPLDTQVAKVSSYLQTLKLQQSAASAAATAVATTALSKPVKKNALEFKRVDQVYDQKIRDWKLVESNADATDSFDCVFTVRRRLNWEGKYQETQVDIKSKVLRKCLQDVFAECKSISLVEDVPQVDPHTLFHYYDELKKYVRKTLKPASKKAKKSKAKKAVKGRIAQCKLLLKYLDEDYSAVRKKLKPMLKAGTITYELVWALFKPNTVAYAETYGNKDDPRCFRVDFNYEYESWLTGAKSLVVDGR
jgi:hypothetical protein